MMNRILKRPMFRMGGRSDDGIMSVRRGYAEGDQVKEPGYFDKSGLGMLLKGIGTEARKAGAGVYDLGGVPLNAASRFFLGENPGFSGARFFGLGEEEGVDPNKAMFLGMETEATPSEMFAGKSLDLGTAAQADDSDIPSVSNDKSTTTTDTDTKTQELSDNDLKTMYEDLLPLFKSELSADEDELKRQKYLELAKFGANILAQPGGDLIGSIGRAAAPSIEGLTRVAETKRRSDAAAKAMALEAALKQADPGTIRKQVNDIMSLDPSLSKTEALAKVLSTGSATKEATAQGRIDDYSTDLLESDYVKDKKAAKAAAEAIEESGLGIGKFNKLPESQDDLEVGEYYIKKDGSVRRFDGEKLLTPSDEGFK
tara:strand:- start:122 stop:1231 length:1110 start_codon:yes stop_codon:yes gene_type:complete